MNLFGKNKRKNTSENEIISNENKKVPYEFNEVIKEVDVHEINEEKTYSAKPNAKYVDKIDNLKIKYKKDPK